MTAILGIWMRRKNPAIQPSGTIWYVKCLWFPPSAVVKPRPSCAISTGVPVYTPYSGSVSNHRSQSSLWLSLWLSSKHVTRIQTHCWQRSNPLITHVEVVMDAMLNRGISIAHGMPCFDLAVFLWHAISWKRFKKLPCGYSVTRIPSTMTDEGFDETRRMVAARRKLHRISMFSCAYMPG